MSLSELKNILSQFLNVVGAMNGYDTGEEIPQDAAAEAGAIFHQVISNTNLPINYEQVLGTLVATYTNEFFMQR